MEIQTAKVSELRPHPQNPRIHPDSAIEKLVKSLKEYGFTNPILISADNYVLAGHARLKAAEKAGLKEVPVIQLPLKGNKALAYMIADNRLQDETDWDFTKLAELFGVLDTGELDLEITGFDLSEIENLLTSEKAGLTDDDAVPEPKESICKAGDLWTLGNHRLLCGDATVAAHVAKLMAGEKADMVFTDPPYGVGYDGGAKKRDKLDGDEIGTSIYADALPLLQIAASDHAALYLWYADAHVAAAAAAAAGYEITAQIIWTKNNAQFVSTAHYHGKHEPCFYAHRKGKSNQWYGGKNEVTVWECDRANKNEYHPTQKPVALAERAIKNSSQVKNIVLDFFGGSGSTLIACEKLNRKCYMMEISEMYCDVIIERWQNFTGRKAEKC